MGADVPKVTPDLLLHLATIHEGAATELEDYKTQLDDAIGTINYHHHNQHHHYYHLHQTIS